MADIPGNTTTTATVTVGGGPVSSTIDTVGDHDWFKITLTAGQAVDITVGLGTLEDSYLNIYDSSGHIVVSDDDIIDGVNRASEVKFDPTYTGTYYIDVSAWADPNAATDGYTGTGTYTVSARPYTPPPLATYDQIASQLTSGYWGGDTHHWNVTQRGTLTVDIHTLTAAEQTLALAALQEWTDIIGVKFQQVTGGGQIVFSDAEDTTANGPVAQTYDNWANGIISSANVQISKSWVTNYGTGIDSYSFETYVHEIGHALGLGHAGNYNNDATYPYDALFENDSWSTSIMSYFSQTDNTYFANQGFSYLYVLTPMVADVVAMQNLYGLSTTTRTGDTVYGDHSNAGGVFDASTYPRAAFTIFDSAGNDTIDYSLSSATQLINLNPETFSNVNGYVGNLAIAPGVVIENAIGGSGSDTLIGNSANNVLTGNAGADKLTGGGGDDTFVDTESNHNGDTVTDFHPGDTIVFSNATLGSFAFSFSGNTLSYTGGSMTVDGNVNGKFSATAAASGGIQLTEVATPAVHNDFNGDSRSDVLWENENGTVTDWIAQSDGSFVGNHLGANAGEGWTFAGSGDFNGDGRADVLWRYTDGSVTEWLGQADGSFAANPLNINPGTSWHLVSTGDFNGDGRTDLFWQNDTGLVTEWVAQRDGTFIGHPLGVNPGTGLHVVGSGDFNGDGRDDVLWQSDDGQVTDWLAQPDGTFVSGPLSLNPGSSWHVVGEGDFNGDGRADIVWQNNDGTITDWLAQPDGSFVGNHLNLSPGDSSHVVEAGDFNGDGRADILLQNDDATVTDWLGQSDGSFAMNQFSINPGGGWHVQDLLG